MQTPHSDISPLELAIAGTRTPGHHVVYLRGGVYRLQRSLAVPDQDGDIVIRACSGETPVIVGPPNLPAIILQGSHHAALIGLTFSGPATVQVVLTGAEHCLIEGNTFLNGTGAILLDHAAKNTIVRNVIVDVAESGIELKDASDSNLIADNVVDGAKMPGTYGGGIFLHAVRDNRVTHNSIANTAGFGIGVSNWDDANINTGNIIEDNLLRRTALDAEDGGAIYVIGRSGVDTGVVIAGNVIDGVGSPQRHSVGIYLDDSTNGAVVTRNLVRNVGSDAVQIHGGQDNTIENNILDLGAGHPSAVLFQAAPLDTHPLNRQTGNVVTGNVIVSSNPRPRLFVWYDGGTPNVSGNFYVLPEASEPVSDPRGSDTSPVMAERGLVADDGYTAIMAAAGRAIGFRPMDLAGAGIRQRSRLQ